MVMGSSIHLKSLYTFVLVGFEQQFNPALAIASAAPAKGHFKTAKRLKRQIL
jgi:hypothetical protein